MMERRQEEVRRGGRRTEVQLDRRRAGELKITEGGEIEVTGCVCVGGWNKKKMGWRIWMQGAYPSGIFPVIKLEQSVVRKKKLTWKRL